MKIYKSISEPVRKNPSFSERWENEESGLVTAWESGRIARNDTFKRYVLYLERGALPKLSFKGGHIMPFDDSYKKPAKYIYKYGSLSYLAQRQGILNHDLDIDTQRDDNLILTCAITGLKTIFTIDLEKYKDNETINKQIDE